MFPVQVHRREGTIGTVSVSSVAASARRAGHVWFSTISMLSKPSGMASGLNAAGAVESGYGDTARTVTAGGLVVLSTLGKVLVEAAVGAAGMAGTVGLADGRHSEDDTWQTLWVQ